MKKKKRRKNHIEKKRPNEVILFLFLQSDHKLTYSKHLQVIMLSKQIARIAPRLTALESLGLRRLLSTTPVIYQKNISIPHPNVTSADYKPPVTVDRELPDPFAKKKTNRRYFVVYAIGMTVACAIIFNYEKTQSPIITSTLYFLRRSQESIDLLGKDIDFSSSWPWISGQLNTVQGKIDIKFNVKGSLGTGVVKLRATRESKLHPFDIHMFSLEVDGKDGSKKVVDLTKDPNVDFDI